MCFFMDSLFLNENNEADAQTFGDAIEKGKRREERL